MPLTDQQTVLTQGRQRLFGTSANPFYCPALHVVQNGALEKLPVYVETHIAIAEHMLCTSRAAPLSANFFRRRSSAYRAVADLMSNPSASISEKMMSLCFLTVTEHAVGRYDLQRLHLNAMHDLVERHGGMRSIFQSSDMGSLHMPNYYLTQYIFIEFDSTNINLIDTGAAAPFFSCLSRIRAWTLRRQTMDDLSYVRWRSYGEQWVESGRTLEDFRAYLLEGINQHLRDSRTVYKQAAGVFYLLFSLCAHMSEFGMDSSTAERFLLLLQLYMTKSAGSLGSDETSAAPATKGGIFRGLRSSVPICLLSQTIRDLQIESQGYKWKMRERDIRDKEVAIAEATASAMKVFPRLSTSTRLRISRALFRSCMVTTEQTLAESFGEEELDDLVYEIQQSYAE